MQTCILFEQKLLIKLKNTVTLVNFKKEILLREKKARKKGTKFIFPLPSVSVV